jgi:hypothetical protein
MREACKAACGARTVQRMISEALISAAATESPRGVPGRPYPKGVSGNPGGRPSYRLPNGKTVPQLAREKTPSAIRLLVRVIEDEALEMPLRVTAAQALLRCGHADVVRGAEVPTEGLTFIVQTLNLAPQPTPGVLSSPIAGHVARVGHPAIPHEDCRGEQWRGLQLDSHRNHVSDAVEVPSVGHRGVLRRGRGWLKK